MARYTGPMTKKSRRLGVDLVGGDAAYERRPYPPGQHGRGRIKESEYLLQLREKQKARYTYDVLDVRKKSLEMTPFIVARETHGERHVPAWIEALPTRMRILIHSVPVRAQIDIPVQEQL